MDQAILTANYISGLRHASDYSTFLDEACALWPLSLR
jgi:hypothetical protein